MSYEQDEAMIVAGDASLNYSRYRDTGCSLHPACLTCPRPTCVYDDTEGLTPASIASERSRQRQKRALEMWDAGLNGPSIAAQLHIGHRTVYRYVRERAKGAAA